MEKIGLIITFVVIVIIILLIALFAASYVKAAPDTAIIITGIGKRKILIGKAGFRIPFLQRIDKLWWDCIKNYSKRDQLFFSYCLFKNNLKPDDIALDNARIDYKNFIVGTHEKSTHT